MLVHRDYPHTQESTNNNNAPTGAPRVSTTLPPSPRPSDLHPQAPCRASNVVHQSIRLLGQCFTRPHLFSPLSPNPSDSNSASLIPGPKFSHFLDTPHCITTPTTASSSLESHQPSRFSTSICLLSSLFGLPEGVELKGPVQILIRCIKFDLWDVCLKLSTGLSVQEYLLAPGTLVADEFDWTLWLHRVAQDLEPGVIVGMALIREQPESDHPMAIIAGARGSDRGDQNMDEGEGSFEWNNLDSQWDSDNDWVYNYYEYIYAFTNSRATIRITG
ncbi:hypothetical protein BDZ91DRAFT_829789 [Kalaharituber pfeilii]|nr:hypothetical protein BDZ91DRAFT_829789 [Kalaharituber pfeilii]